PPLRGVGQPDDGRGRGGGGAGRGAAGVLRPAWWGTPRPLHPAALVGDHAAAAVAGASSARWPDRGAGPAPGVGRFALPVLRGTGVAVHLAGDHLVRPRATATGRPGPVAHRGL